MLKGRKKVTEVDDDDDDDDYSFNFALAKKGPGQTVVTLRERNDWSNDGILTLPKKTWLQM